MVLTDGGGGGDQRKTGALRSYATATDRRRARTGRRKMSRKHTLTAGDGHRRCDATASEEAVTKPPSPTIRARDLPIIVNFCGYWTAAAARRTGWTNATEPKKIMLCNDADEEDVENTKKETSDGSLGAPFARCRVHPRTRGWGPGSWRRRRQHNAPTMQVYHTRKRACHIGRYIIICKVWYI